MSKQQPQNKDNSSKPVEESANLTNQEKNSDSVNSPNIAINRALDLSREALEIAEIMGLSPTEYMRLTGNIDHVSD